MERFSVIFFSLCSLAILAGSMPADSLATIETLRDNANDIRDVENHHADLLKPKNVQNNTEYPLANEYSVKNTTQVGNYIANISLTDDFSDGYIKDSRDNGAREGNASWPYHKKEPSVGLSSHDFLLDPGLIPARLSRQAEKSDADYSNLASIENISGDGESNNHVGSRSVFSSRRSSNFEGELDVAEDRYQPPYPYWYYRGQFPNQRNRADDRREPYRNYLRYPIFPGK